LTIVSGRSSKRFYQDEKAALVQIFKLAANNSAWTQQIVDLMAYKGQTIRIYFNCHGDGATDPTTLYIDDVSVKVTQ